MGLRSPKDSGRFARDRRGATAVEFALVSAPFIALLIASLQTALVYLAGQALETATEKAGRQLLTGQTQTQGQSQSQYLANVCQSLPSILPDCNNLMVDVQTYASFGLADPSTPTITFAKDGSVSNKWNFNPGGPGDIVVLRVMYLFPVVGGPLNFTLANVGNGKHLLLASAVFKNEPYK